MTGQELFAHLAQGDELAQLRAERDEATSRWADAAGAATARGIEIERLNRERDALRACDRASAGAVEAARSLRGHCDWLEARVVEMEAERDQLRARVAELESQEAMRLDALRELARLRVEEPALRARVAELEADAAYSARAAKQSILALTERCAKLRARVSLHETLPVVPEGWCVSRPNGAEWVVSQPRRLDRTPTILAAVYRALAWAIEHDERPPHAGDKP